MSPNMKSYRAGSLVSSLRELIMGSESYGSRPSMTIDVCSDRQVQLVLEVWFLHFTFHGLSKKNVIFLTLLDSFFLVRM